MPVPLDDSLGSSDRFADVVAGGGVPVLRAERPAGTRSGGLVIVDPMPCTAVAVNLQQLHATRFTDVTRAGVVPAETMPRVDQALRAVLDL